MPTKTSWPDASLIDTGFKERYKRILPGMLKRRKLRKDAAYMALKTSIVPNGKKKPQTIKGLKKRGFRQF